VQSKPGPRSGTKLVSLVKRFDARGLQNFKMDSTPQAGVGQIFVSRYRDALIFNLRGLRPMFWSGLLNPMANTFVFSSESVGEGHPDKVADLISDSVLDACLAIDKTSRVACETFVKSNIVVVGGEITIPKLQDKKTGKTKALEEAINLGKIIRDAIRHIGYTNFTPTLFSSTTI